jgi:hypothetical protein
MITIDRTIRRPHLSLGACIHSWFLFTPWGALCVARPYWTWGWAEFRFWFQRWFEGRAG